MMVAETDNFCERGGAIAPGLNVANLAHRCERSFGLHDQADQLHDSPARFSDFRLANSSDGVIQAIGGKWNRLGHKFTAFRSCSSLVSRCASTSPNRV